MLYGTIKIHKEDPPVQNSYSSSTGLVGLGKFSKDQEVVIKATKDSGIITYIYPQYNNNMGRIEVKVTKGGVSSYHRCTETELMTVEEYVNSSPLAANDETSDVLVVDGDGATILPNGDIITKDNIFISGETGTCLTVAEFLKEAIEQATEEGFIKDARVLIKATKEEASIMSVTMWPQNDIFISFYEAPKIVRARIFHKGGVSFERYSIDELQLMATPKLVIGVD